jgi:hypothetical protein
MYGAMGVQKGYLPFMPGAMSTTAMGRMSIQKAAEYVKKKHHGQLIYGDSVAGDTPLCLRYDDRVHFIAIEDFYAQFPSKAYPQFRPQDETLLHKEQAIPQGAIEILGGNGWTGVQRVIRHATTKTMYKITTSSGVVEVTEDHSLVLENGDLIKPSKLTTNHRLMCIPENEKKAVIGRSRFCATDLKYMEVLDNHRITVSRDCPPLVWARLMCFLQGNWPDLRLNVMGNGDVVMDLRNTRGLSRGVVLRIEKTRDNERLTVYDIETEEGRFHCGVGELVVKNTDSIYCHFNTKQDSETVWKLAKSVEGEFIRLFPKPMKLVFEEKIYQTFLILTKKRYMAYTCNEDGTTDKDLTTRGVLLARRDNCRWVRQVYEKVVRSIMDRASQNEVLEFVNTAVLALFRWNASSVSDFVVSKLVGKDYKIRALPTDPKKFQKRCADLQLCGVPVDMATEEIERKNRMLLETPDKVRDEWLLRYIEKAQPAHVQLAMRMKRRGHPVEAGTRIEYLISENNKSKLNEKLEDPDYFKTHRDLLRLGRLYYVQLLSKPLDQLLEIVYGLKDFSKNLCALHTRHKKLMTEVEEKSGPILRFEGDPEPKKKTVKKKAAAPKPKVKITGSIYDYME